MPLRSKKAQGMKMRNLLIAVAAGCRALRPAWRLPMRARMWWRVSRAAPHWPDDRQWLDCYYGAAQPMRSQLGLSPRATGAAQASGSPAQDRGRWRFPPRFRALRLRTGPPPMPKRTGVFNMWGGDDLVRRFADPVL